MTDAGYSRTTACFLALALASLAAPGRANDALLPGIASNGGENTAQAAAAESHPVAQQWWQVFGMAELDPLIERVHAGNQGIAQAKARLAMARAAVRSGEAVRLPTLGTDAAASYASGPLINDAGGSGSLLNIGISASWDIDLFGIQSGNRRAARQDAEAAEADLRAATLLLEAEAVNAWLMRETFAATEVEAALVVALKEERYAIISRRFDLGNTTQIALDSARRDLDAARETEAHVTFLRDQAGRQLTYLTGEKEDPTLAAPAALISKAKLPDVPADLPADILMRRPDLVAAQLRVRAADDRLASQRKSWLPQLSLTGSGGVASTSLGTLLSQAATGFGLAGLLAIPIFDGGRNRAAIAQRKAEGDLVRSQYEDQVLRALRDVHDHFQMYQDSRQSLSRAADADTAGGRLFRTARARYANGSISRLGQIEAELDAAQRRMAHAQAQGRTFQATTSLVLALGGTW